MKIKIILLKCLNCNKKSIPMRGLRVGDVAICEDCGYAFDIIEKIVISKKQMYFPIGNGHYKQCEGFKW